MINEFLANDGGAQNHSSVFLNVDLSSDYMNVCALPVYDVFHPTIKKFVKPYTSADDCDNNITMITELKNGEWRILQEGANCSARCIEGIGAKNFKKGNWSKPGRVKCEFLEAVCWKGEKEVYGYMHSQVIRK
uniref:Uncharacterized protein n=1 Tax=Caenorhabditis japonica TaxID=281687 RepID=A0A8R1I452_CAEJA